MARSNGFPFQVIDAAPFQDIGFEVRVIHQKDFEKLCAIGLTVNPPTTIGRNLIQPLLAGAARALTVISRFVEVSLSVELSGVGAGSITLDLDDELFAGTLANGEPATTLLEYEHLWQVYENGALRGAFLGQVVTESIQPSGNGEVRAITISGPGPADVLRWGVVMTPWYPNATPIPTTASEIVESPYNFKRISHMGAWRLLLADCKKRGTLKFVCPNFNKDVDSGGECWPDLPEPIPDPNIVTQTLAANVLFFVDSSTLTDAAAATLNSLTPSFMNMKAPQLTVVGHTDSTNTVAYNQGLSERRARAVKDFLLSKVPQAVITANGRGELQPVATNKTVHGRELNRRVVITYPVGPPYTAETYFAPTIGGNLLDLLIEWTGQNVDEYSPLRAEWYMQPTFQLDVRLSFGTRREYEVVFYEGSTATVSKDRERRRADIRNFIASQIAGGGTYTLRTDADSLARWRQRETYLAVASGFNDTARNDIVQANLELTKNETSSWTVKVPAYGEGRRVFEDYTLGDWIGVSRFLGGTFNTVEAYRVMAITMHVNSTNEVDLELTLQSKVESYLSRLRSRLSTALKKSGTQVFIQDDEPPNAKIGDLWTPLTTGLYG